MTSEYRDLIQQAAATHGLDAALVAAIVTVESSGQTDAFRFEPGFYSLYLKHRSEYAGQIPRRISSSYGLMQVMYTTAQQHGFVGEPEALFQPRIGLHYGCLHLRWLLGWANGDREKAIGAYNAGQGHWQSAPAVAYRVKVRDALTAIQGSIPT